VQRFAAVLFDNGDTLFHKPLAPPAIKTLATRLGRPISEPEAVAAWASVKAYKRSITDEDLIFGRNRSARGHQRYYTTCYAPLDEIAPGLASAFYTHFKTNPASMIPYPDTSDVLRALRETGLALGIVSNTGWDIRAGYRRAGIDHLIDTFVLSFEHGIAKPERDLFEIACSNLAVEPSEVLMVGNNGLADSGAAALGCTCLILPPVSRGEVRGLDAVLRLAGSETVAATVHA
jgi:HAD superfamily hydrolase (TIGR01549 family)